MQFRERHKTGYAGIFYVMGKAIGGKGEEKIYYMVFKKNGKVHEEKAGRQFADNMTPAKASHLRYERINGKLQSRTEQKAAQATANVHSCRTIAELWEYFRTQRANGLASKHGLQVDTSNYRLHLAHLAKVKVEDLGTADVAALRDRVSSQGKSPQTVKHVLSLLRRMIRFAVKNGQCSMPDPSKLQFDMPKVDNQTTEHLTPEQLVALKKALDEEPDQNAASFVRIALLTGMRKGAIIGLKWDDIDFERGFITLAGETAKNNRTAQIPMNKATRDVLQKVTRTASPYVFPGRNGQKRSDFCRVSKRVRDKAGLPKDFRPLHGLRHAYASFLASSGKVDLYTLQRLLTQNSPEMTQRYAHLADEAMQRAASVADEMFIKEGEKK